MSKANFVFFCVDLSAGGQITSSSFSSSCPPPSHVLIVPFAFFTVPRFPSLLGRWNFTFRHFHSTLFAPPVHSFFFLFLFLSLSRHVDGAALTSPGMGLTLEDIDGRSGIRWLRRNRR